MKTLQIRVIEPHDDDGIARVIRQVMPEFGAGGPGFAIHDAEVDNMFAAYCEPRSYYLVIADAANQIFGGGGIAPLVGGRADQCELKKMYFLPSARGLGLGGQIIDRLLRAAKQRDFAQCYIETLTGMDAAQHLYRQKGFRELSGPVGNTGHFSCDKWFLRDLSDL